MKTLNALAVAVALAVIPGAALAQSVGNTGPARADTTDPNSAPRMGSQGTLGTQAPAGVQAPASPTTGQGLDAAGRANTSDPQSTMSGGTTAAGTPANPMADPRQR